MTKEDWKFASQIAVISVISIATIAGVLGALTVPILIIMLAWKWMGF